MCIYIYIYICILCLLLRFSLDPFSARLRGKDSAVVGDYVYICVHSIYIEREI